jgi:hypothetical protein
VLRIPEKVVSAQNATGINHRFSPVDILLMADLLPDLLFSLQIQWGDNTLLNDSHMPRYPGSAVNQQPALLFK